MKKLLLIIFLFVTLSANAQVIPVAYNQHYFSSEASQYFNRMPVKPAVDTLLMMAEFIDSLVLNGVWAKLDVMCLLANRDSTSALQNLKQNLYNGVGYGTRTFTPYKGWAGNGTSGYINTGFNPFDSTTHNYRTQSASIGFYKVSGTTLTMGTNMNTTIDVLIQSAGAYVRINNLSWWVATGGSELNTFDVLNRLTSTSETFAQGTTVYSRTASSVGLGNANLYLGAYNNGTNPAGFTNGQSALYFIGGGLTAQNVIDFNSCVSRLKTKIGW